jgi:NADH-quinone oxidoreductase subunit J
MLDQIFFYLFAAVILAGAVLTITQRNAVHSAIFLIMTLLGVAGLYLHLHAEFLAGVQVILYVGGIMVLFLFVVLLVNLDQAARERQFSQQWIVALAAVAVLGVELGYFVYQGSSAFNFPPPAAPAKIGNTQQIGNVLFQNYLLPFEIASILLLVAMVGAVVMAKKRV